MFLFIVNEAHVTLFPVDKTHIRNLPSKIISKTNLIKYETNGWSK